MKPIIACKTGRRWQAEKRAYIRLLENTSIEGMRNRGVVPLGTKGLFLARMLQPWIFLRHLCAQVLVNLVSIQTYGSLTQSER